jgi:heterodisulfide reductase subunit C
VTVDHTVIHLPTTANHPAEPMLRNSRLYNCFACGECSSACPIACDRDIFDPRTILRMARLERIDDLINNPAIWLCLQCGRCSEACSQLVDGSQVIKILRQWALDHERIDGDFTLKLERSNALLFRRLLTMIDTVFGFETDHPSQSRIAAAHA